MLYKRPSSKLTKSKSRRKAAPRPPLSTAVPGRPRIKKTAPGSSLRDMERKRTEAPIRGRERPSRPDRPAGQRERPARPAPLLREKKPARPLGRGRTKNRATVAPAVDKKRKPIAGKLRRRKAQIGRLKERLAKRPSGPRAKIQRERLKHAKSRVKALREKKKK